MVIWTLFAGTGHSANFRALINTEKGSQKRTTPPRSTVIKLLIDLCLLQSQFNFKLRRRRRHHHYHQSSTPK